jgi:hypothetical protein
LGQAYELGDSKGVTLSPIGEGFLSAGFQFVSDFDGDYSLGQRAGRVTVAGIEATITDLASTGAGALAAGTSSPTGPGAVAAYVGAAFVVNEVFEFGIWPAFNQLFPGLGYR